MNIAILDDQLPDRKKAATCMQTYFSRYPLEEAVNIFEFENGEAFLNAFWPGHYQLVLIDYYLDGISGLETARKIRETDNQAVLIFITASRDYSIDGYKVRASGYLVKPFQYCELEEILVLTDMEKRKDLQYIELAVGNSVVRIVLHDIIYCDMEGHYVQIHDQKNGPQKFRVTFSYLTGLLKPYKSFLPCYRGCIINMRMVQRIEEFNFCMVNGEQIPFRKRGKALLMKKYSDFLFEKVRESEG